MKLYSVIQLLRIHQWLKNLFLFLPLYFDRKLCNIEIFYSTIIAFTAFSFISSAIYCFNDIIDVELDKVHITKKNRPIANGTITIKQGYYVIVICVLLSFIFALFTSNKIILLTILILYLILNISYCLKLKNYSIIDVFIISIGFVLRILAGASVGYIYISHWIIIMTFLLALFLALAKRRDDVILYLEKNRKIRNNVCQYNLDFLNQSLGLIGGIIIVAYIMYTVSAEVIERIGNSYLYTTSIFVLAGIFRYLQITFVDIRSGSPTKILINDRFIQFCIIGWLVVFTWILYL